MARKGNMTTETFDQYIDFFLKHTEEERSNGQWVLLLMDGYGPHTMNPQVLQKMADNRVHAVCLPSHTSHLLQPLDVSCFRPSKQYFRNILDEWTSRELKQRGNLRQVNKWRCLLYFHFVISSTIPLQ